MPRAAQREPVREPTRDSARSRRNANASTDRFYINPDKIPEGMDYNWKRLSVKGEIDTEHQIDLAENGWTPVPAERHPDKAGRDAAPGSSIVRGGQVLMERPKILSKEANQEDLDKSREQLRTQFLRLGQTERGALPRERPKARRTYEPAPADVPNDAA